MENPDKTRRKQVEEKNQLFGNICSAAIYSLIFMNASSRLARILFLTNLKINRLARVGASWLGSGNHIVMLDQKR